MKSDPSVHSFASMGITQKELCHMRMFNRF
jgi:hypothetical protein